ncbi:PREDICTED: aspartic proteinase CDR1-like [Nelumbo nucifera]|uniref:Peptidase A1 domain-containing protein n=2 Tax=Nelumbo nucifera TaxID=4432 RepID=A0A822Y127_NELNU|nr:PREDICTED: aspartic proteinase CDR1-like [Nelumbo nucifera]DAD24946.1 TPA_asm: hypothetical protein HUJ06_026410 [Nelumbo nucifera]
MVWILLMIILIHLPEASHVQAKDGSFSVELIHRDYSPFSPFYNDSDTPLERLRKSFHRSRSRLEYFRSTIRSLASATSSANSFASMVTPSNAEYLVKLSIGTPPFEFFAIVDTGSDLTWAKCKPPNQVYDADASLFDPQSSSTYHVLPCFSTPCKFLNPSFCASEEACRYSYSYRDNSSTVGTLAVENLSFNPVARGNIVFGCADTYSGVLSQIGAGFIGLGGGSLSLVTQLGASIGGKFSYCLVPMQENNISSILSFGSSAMAYSSDTVSTPLTPKEPKTFYYLTLEGLSVNNQSFDAVQAPGNIIIDSGTENTYLSVDLYNQLELALLDFVNLTRAEDLTGIYQLCFERNEPLMATLPDIVFRFSDAKLVLGPLNTFVDANGLVCLAILPSDDGFSIFGNVAQRNFLVSYDLEERKVSFARTKCSSSSANLYSHGVHFYPSIVFLILSVASFKLLTF